MKLFQALSGFALLAGAAASPQADALHERVPQDKAHNTLFERAVQRAARGGIGSLQNTNFESSLTQKYCEYGAGWRWSS
jgi:hypothetical protein